MTRLALRLAETLPHAAFLGMDRLADDGAVARARVQADPTLKTRVDQTMAWLAEDGATASDPLIALLAEFEAEPAVAGDAKAATLDAMAKRLPVGRPDDIADAIRFLMQASFVTGTVLHIEGGHRLV
jgi:NAD(P)-dependent dehydrogenase (short-subunit alcohol dehydrogenase family)